MIGPVKIISLKIGGTDCETVFNYFEINKIYFNLSDIESPPFGIGEFLKPSEGIYSLRGKEK
jgi:hypothetical protein